MDLKLVKEDETLDDLQLNGIHIIQKRDAFRFGVDAVLLANFASVKENMSVIDLCSGNGIVPLIICGKTKAGHVTGVEVQQDMSDMARRSAIYNNMTDRLEFVHGDITDLDMLQGLPKCDAVTVNPPYKLRNSGIISENDKDAIARHEILCTLEDVIKACKTVLKENGKVYMIHRPNRIPDIMCLMRKYKIEPKLMRMIYPNSKKAPNMILVEGRNNGGQFLKWLKPLYVHNDQGGYTDEIEKIYGRDGNDSYEPR
jgi:tRNA1(Val) A37 N6-methylase TrmN6